MAWEAPNLLDKIFSQPRFDPTQYNSTGNFLSGFLGGYQQAQDKKYQEEQAQTISDMTGTAEPSQQKPNWLAETIKGAILGKEMQDPLKYQQSVLNNKLLMARGINETLDNRLKSLQLDSDTESKTQIARWQEAYGKNPTDIINSPVPPNPAAAKYVLEAKHAAAQTIAGSTVIQDAINFNKSLAGIDPEDRAMIREMTPNQDGTPSSQQMKVLSIAEEKVRNRQLAAQEEKALTASAPLAAQIRQETALKISGEKNETALKVARTRADATKYAADLRNLITNRPRDASFELFQKKLLAIEHDKSMTAEQQIAKMDELAKQHGVSIANPQQNRPSLLTPNAPVTPPASPAPKQRVRVIGPGGVRGTVEQGDTLPDGWSLE